MINSISGTKEYRKARLEYIKHQLRNLMYEASDLITEVAVIRTSLYEHEPTAWKRCGAQEVIRAGKLLQAVNSIFGKVNKWVMS